MPRECTALDQDSVNIFLLIYNNTKYNPVISAYTTTSGGKPSNDTNHARTYTPPSKLLNSKEASRVTSTC